MDFGLVVIGDEILSGRREDKHFAKVRELLAARGLQLAWARYVGDERQRIEAALRESFAGDDVVFCCGGIGATPDDHTRQAAAAALGAPLVLHPEAQALITERCAEMAREGRGSADMTRPENRQRLRMGEFPQGARIVPNPFNRIPGFSVGSHWFVPGFPVMAWPMIEWVLDTHYQRFFFERPVAVLAFIVRGLPESVITPALESVEQAFPGVRVFCLPTAGVQGRPGQIELGVKGDPRQVDAACQVLRESVSQLGGEIGEMPPAG
ncbi:MAG: molybdopterin-binding protein [Pseudomonadota bacterium]|nr:molybdopterin-binding protein [Pseudomonadota bacterium]